MRISDWSSDVCSSDLSVVGQIADAAVAGGVDVLHHAVLGHVDDHGTRGAGLQPDLDIIGVAAGRLPGGPSQELCRLDIALSDAVLLDRKSTRLNSSH